MEPLIVSAVAELKLDFNLQKAIAAELEIPDPVDADVLIQSNSEEVVSKQ